MKTLRITRSLFGLGVFLSLHHALAAPLPVPVFDFTDPAVCAQWGQPHHISGLRYTPEGLEITIAGMDPYFFGPSRDYPTNALWLEVKLRSETGGGGQIFWFTRNATENQSIHFSVPPGEWKTVRLGLPALGIGYRLRIDPPGTSGRCLLASIRFLAQPDWGLPQFPSLSREANANTWQGSSTVVRFSSKGWGGFEVGRVGETRRPEQIAESHSRMLIGYLRQEKPVWFCPATNAQIRNVPAPNGEMNTAVATDPDGARWTISQRLAKTGNQFDGAIETTVSVDQDRDVIFLPLVFLVASQGDTNKQQAIFSGLEYLDNEPSSSEADLIGPASRRQVPDPVKITQPLMTLLMSNSWFRLIWENNPRLAAFFDSPDRAFGTGGHVMGLLFPGFTGWTRTDGQWLPNEPARLKAGEKVTARVFIKTGTGKSLEPALKDYVQRYGLPAMPEKTPSWEEYLQTASGGWLDSKARESNLVRHAVWPGFNATPAADAPVYMEWLAVHTTDPKLRERLTNAAAQMLSAVSPARWAFAQVSHVQTPVAPLVFGHIAENQKQARLHAQHLLGRFNPAGFVPYHPSPKGEDYGRTYHTNHANGLTAQVTSTLLEAAVFSGDTELIQEALKKVRALKDLYQNGVPRGAQTWEVPLHTPDILASAYLVRANALAWELTGDKTFYDGAAYWAWTGVPFVYLVNPAEKDIGVYTTIAVFGATGWKAPVWMGLPVQWCGLVYADALYRFGGEAVPGVTWKKLADGITAAGAQITWPLSDKERQGLLPDSFLLREQHRDGPAINPGTLQACAPRYYGRLPIYECKVIRAPAGAQTLTIHAPGEVVVDSSNGARAPSFTVNLWPNHPVWVLVNGVQKTPRCKLNGQVIEISAPHEFDATTGSLRLQLQGRVRVELE